MHSYAIGDIHGHISLLREAHDRIADDMARHGAGPVIHIGDLVDRGRHSAEVIEFLRTGVDRGENWVILKGNHDRMLTGFLVDPFAQDRGLRTDLGYLHPKIGGATTLASYGVRSAADRPVAAVHADALLMVPPSHRAFLEALPTHYRRGEAIFVHAGIRPGIALEDQTETDLLWIRAPFLDDLRDHGALIVHGHTAIDQPTHYGNRLNIDSGAAYGGLLSAVVIEGRRAFHLTDGGRVPL